MGLWRDPTGALQRWSGGADRSFVEANNGYEYKIVKGRPWSLSKRRAAERLVARAVSQGWEVVNTSLLEGWFDTPVVTLKRRVGSDHVPQPRWASTTSESLLPARYAP